MKVLVSGAHGQLGRALREGLAAHHVVPCGREELDVRDLDRVRTVVRETAPDAVVNAAAWTRVDDAESEPEEAFRANALGPRNLALVTSELGIPLLHVSTDYVFDGRKGTAYHEWDAPAPRSVYGRSKLAGEDAVRTHNPRHRIVRTAWLYGPEGRNFPRTILSLASRDEVRVVEDQLGSPTWCPHLARGIARLLEVEAYGTWHVAGDGGTSWYELTRTLYRELAIETPVRPVSTAEFPRPAERPPCGVLTTLQSPEIRLPPWEDGLREFAAGVRSGAIRV